MRKPGDWGRDMFRTVGSGRKRPEAEKLFVRPLFRDVGGVLRPVCGVSRQLAEPEQAVRAIRPP